MVIKRTNGCFASLRVLNVCRFTSSDTQTETVVLPVRVVDSSSGLVLLGSTPLLVPRAYGVSNVIDPKVLRIQTRGYLICTVRLLDLDTGVPSLGQLVREDASAARTGTATLDVDTERWKLVSAFVEARKSRPVEMFVFVVHQAGRRVSSVQEINLVPAAPRTSTP